ncbi:glycosyltransferase family 9 protein [Algibacter aquimarinus]|uniref:Glycosyltransferase family 9 protein n=1 Tax=Algibacter aquimarinus TaxID=1136748 RepID=A0ABP9HCF5_9FLAO
MPKQKHILVIRLSALGDVAMTVPVLKILNQNYPELKITVLTRAFFKPLFRDLKNTTVFSAEVKTKHKGIFGLYKLARQISKENKFYVIADLHNVLRSKVLKKFLRCKRFISIDKGRAEKRALVSGKIVKQLKTTHQRYADVFEALGYKIDLSKPIFLDSAVLNNKVLSLVGEKSEKRIGIAPFAAHKGKMYPLDLIKKVIEVLSENYQILLFGGGKQEVEILNKFEVEYKNTLNLAGKLSFNEELDVISNLDVMLSMDSGNGHLAAMFGVKVVTIWGVTHPYAGFSPFNQPQDYALIPDLKKFTKIPTSVYGNKYPEEYEEASRSISPEAVVNKLKSIL